MRKKLLSRACVGVISFLLLGAIVACSKPNASSIAPSEEHLESTAEVKKSTVGKVTGLTITEAVNTLKTAGFTNITFNTVENWDESRVIVTEQSVAEGTEWILDDKIELVCKRLCEVSFSIKSEDNLLFSRYDMDLYIDDQLLGTVANGDSLIIHKDILEGPHDIVAVNAEKNSIKESKRIDVNGNMSFKCDLAHGSSSIEFKNAVTTDVVEETDAEMINVVGQILAEAKKNLSAAGFTNIEAKAEKSIWDEENWVVSAQSIKVGEKINLAEQITLTCINIDDYYTLLFVGKPLDEALKTAEKEDLVLECRDKKSYREVDISSLSEDELQNWVVETAEKKAFAENTVKLGISNIAQPEESETETIPEQTEVPTEAPTEEPTEVPTEKPTETPTTASTEAATEETKQTEPPTTTAVATTEKRTEAPTTTAQRVTVEEVMAIISSNLAQTGTLQYSIQRQDYLVYVTVWSEGIEDAAFLAKNRIGSAKSQWKSMMTNLTYMDNSFKNLFDSAGLNEYNVAVVLLSDKDKDTVLASILNGVVVYDITD